MRPDCLAGAQISGVVHFCLELVDRLERPARLAWFGGGQMMRRRVSATLWFEKLKSRFWGNVAARGVLQISAGTASAQAVALLSYPLLTRMYDPTSFGAVAVYTSLIGLITTVATLGYESAVPLPRTDQGGLDVVTLALTLNLGFSALLVGVTASFPQVFSLLVKDAEFPHYVLWTVPLGVALSGTYKVLRAWAVRSRAYGVISTTKVTQALAQSGTQLFLGLTYPSGASLVVGNMIGSGAGIGSIVSRTMRGRGLKRPALRALGATARRYWRFVALGVPATLLSVVASTAPALLISGFYSLAVAGQFGLAVRIVAGPLVLLGGSLENVFYGEASRIGKGKPQEIERLVRKLTLRIAAVGIGPTVIIAIWAPGLFELAFGAGWVQAGVFARYLSIAMFLQLLTTPFTGVYMVFERLETLLGVSAVKALAAVGPLVAAHFAGFGAGTALLLYACSTGLAYVWFGLQAGRVLQRAKANESLGREGE